MLIVKRLAACVAIALIAGGCARSRQSTTIEAAFDCTSGGRLSVTFDNKANVAIVRTQDGGMHVLTHTISGSGYRYEAEGRELRGKGREAMWTDKGTSPLTCNQLTN